MAEINNKKQAVSLLGFDANHIRHTEGYVQAVNNLYYSAVQEFAKVAEKANVNPNKLFSFNDYPQAKTQAETIIKGLSSKIYGAITKGSEEQWLYACKKNDEFLNSIINTSAVPKATLERWQDKNLDALKTFQTRKISGLGLSDRIWQYTGQMKTQMELSIDIALGEGKSAAQLSRDLRQYLVDPDKLFHKVRNKHGQLVLSKNAAAFHPGQGKYRSSYKNAMRLTRSEINMAYRESDQLRWEQLDFVVGFEVKLSNNHTLNGVPFYDVCDELKGKYPKSFKFKGWHPQCRCHAIPIMQDPDEFNTDELNELTAAINGTEYQKFVSKNTVNDVPEGFKGWIADNAERSKGWKSQPYFIRDNFAGGNIAGGLKVATKSAETLAAEKAAAESAKVAAEAAKLAAEKAAKAQALLEKTTKMSNNLVAKAEKAGYTGEDLDSLKAALAKEGTTNAELNKLYQKLKAGFASATEAAADPLSEAGLLKKFSQSEVDALLKNVNGKIKSISTSNDIAQQIKDLKFEAEWVAKYKKYSTWQEAEQLYLKRVKELEVLLKQEQAKTAILQIESQVKFLNNAKLTAEYDKLVAEVSAGKIQITDPKVTKLVDKIQTLRLKAVVKNSSLSARKIEKYCEQNRTYDFIGDDFSDFDKLQRHYTNEQGALWATAKSETRDAMRSYTNGGYSHMNRMLYDNKKLTDEAKKVAEFLDQCATSQDLVLRRGTDTDEILSIFGNDFLQNLQNREIDKLIGQRGVNESFISTSFSESGGFSGRVEFVYYTPKGTQASYAKPYSVHDQGHGGRWNGYDLIKHYSASAENEFIVNHGYELKVTKIEYGGGRKGAHYRIFVDVLSREKRIAR